MYPLPKDKHRSWIPHGTILLNPEETKYRIFLESHMRNLFLNMGHSEITLPTFDYAETFQLTTREIGIEPTFKMTGREGEQLALRSDITVQVIKAIANKRILPDNFDLPLKYFYIQSVFQDHSWGSGHQREKLQAGVELLNDNSSNRVSTLIELAKKCLSKLSSSPHILYGDIRVIEKLFQDIPQKIYSDISIAFHNKDTASIQSIGKEIGWDPNFTQILAELPLLFGDKKILVELKKLCKSRTDLYPFFDEASNIDDVIYDFSLVRELSYYTGPVFEAYIPHFSEKIFTGGVYDKLYSEFSSEKECSASGFAVDLSLMIRSI